MSEELTVDCQRRLLRQLHDAIERRVQSEEQIATDYSDQRGIQTASFMEAKQQSTGRYEREKAELEQEYADAVRDAETRFRVDYETTERQYRQTVESIHQHFERASDVAAKERDDAKWMVNSYFDESADDSPKHHFEAFKARIVRAKESIETAWNELDQIGEQVHLLLRRRRMGTEAVAAESMAPIADREKAREHFEQCAEAAKSDAARIQSHKLSRVFSRWFPFVAFLVLWGATFAAVRFTLNPALLGIHAQASDPDWMGLVAGISVGVYFVVFMALYGIARWQVSPLSDAFQQHLAEARWAHRCWQKVAKTELDQSHKEYHRWYSVIVEKRDHGLKKADDTYAEKMAQLEAEKAAGLAAAEAKYPDLLQQITERRDQQLAQAHEHYPPRLQQLDDRIHAEEDQLWKQNESRLADIKAQYEQAWRAMADDWNSTYADVVQTVERMQSQRKTLFPEWEQLASQQLTLPHAVPPSLPIGQYDVRLKTIPGGLSEDPRLIPETTQFTLPALLPFPENPSLVLHTHGIGRTAAVQFLQSVMMRALTSLPAGKVRFTILDPVGLGENFSAFMHLADYDELMITNRIWTESGHIEQRLTDLTEHMEDVFQTYLRNEFQTIEEYNHHAGEVAEPYHFLVIANFPANFTENAARRLISIINSGPRCGVFTLISVDEKQPIPYNFQMADLQHHGSQFQWQDYGFVPVDPTFAELPLTLEEAPPVAVFSDLVKAVGNESKDARRVEVSFDRVAPPTDRLWTADSRGGIDVPLGRAGATKLQHLNLGKGTSQHVLVAGKTGSGKSSFLHALIVNASLHYSPDQLQFYLIDFKKGVEFKPYATQALPHARVIAIESDREFGLSTLQKVDSILKERGDLFRQIGVQDVAGYRDACPDQTLPRLMLIIDEFQEFFVEDDKIGQQAALLLDRLVRQGRAFGIHVLLGSQTLGGAYSLARSTMGQVAVRVALQCSENDAHLILSEENTAARLLTRPGEAIYNDANGLLEGNHPFQIAWLPDDARERHLQRILELTKEKQIDASPPIVFEGNIPADPRRNVALCQLLESPEAKPPSHGVQAWLGEAVAIKAPTSVTFRRQSGTNLLIAGQHAPSALGILSTCVTSLAVQHAVSDAQDAPKPARFFVFDGTHPEELEAGTWVELHDALPNDVNVIDPRDVSEVITELSSEVTRRTEERDIDAEPLYLIVFNLARFRDLRRDDDDYGFGSLDKEKKASTGKQFSDILRDGPAVGIHALIWCDTYNNINRWLSRDSLRELEMRVVFQMSSADSSNLIDSPAAGRLGTNRALLRLETEGTLEKFRPYARPTDDWLARLRKTFGTGEGSSVDVVDAVDRVDEVHEADDAAIVEWQSLLAKTSLESSNTTAKTASPTDATDHATDHATDATDHATGQPDATGQSDQRDLDSWDDLSELTVQ